VWAPASKRGGGCSRTLHDDRHDDSDRSERPGRGSASPRERLEVPRNALHPILQLVDPGEDQADAGQDRPNPSRRRRREIVATTTAACRTNPDRQLTFSRGITRALARGPIWRQAD